MKKAIVALLLIGLFLSTAGCSLVGPEKMPGVDIPLESMNDKLQLSAPSEINTYKVGDDLYMVLVNLSDKVVILPQDYGVHIYEQVNNQWEIVKNGIENPQGEKEVSPKSNQPFPEVIVIASPLVFSDQPVKLRVVVVGNYEENGKPDGEEVGAYVDVTMKPK
jgi:predicted small lipoprotein YifL